MSRVYFRFLFVTIFIIACAALLNPQQVLAAGPWYVSTTGDDSNNCLSPGSPCATINRAISDASAGDTIYVATGTYTGTGAEVVFISRSISLSGGWNSGFVSQDGYSTIDAQASRRGIAVNNSATASLDRFVVRNGLFTNFYGGGIYSEGNLSITNSAIHSNSIGNLCYGGGIFFSGQVLSIENTTVANNIAGCNGGGVFTSNLTSVLNINNSTISGNSRGGIYINGIANLNNTIISGNAGEDCNGTSFTSLGYNIIGNTNNCTITPATGDQFNIDPRLGPLWPNGGFVPLIADSPAINAGNPASCLSTDQRGVARDSSCDIGAFEYISPGQADSLEVAGGNNQITGTGTAFPIPLQVAAFDNQGNLVEGVTIDFAAPASGPSGTFANTGSNTTSATTDLTGIATTSEFTANDQTGSYTVTASGIGLGLVSFNLEQMVRPPNDNFSNATAIASLPFNATVDNTEATTEPGEPPTCSASFRSVWYTITPTESMALRLDMAGSQIQGAVSIYQAQGPGISDLNFIACEFSGSTTNIRVEAGQTYYLRVDSFGQAGVLQINLEQIVPPNNDDFANAEVIPALPFSTTVDNTNATVEFNEVTSCGGLYRSVWYTFTPTEDMAIRLSMTGSQVAGSANLFQATGPGITDLLHLGCAFPFNDIPFNSQLEAEQTYYIRLDSNGGQPGVLQINLQQITPPANDNFADTEEIDSLPFNAMVDNTNATTEPGEPSDCGVLSRSLWFSFSPTVDTPVRINAAGSSVSAVLSVYLATGPEISNLSRIACAGSNSILLQLEAGEKYYIQVDSFGQAGNIQINLELSNPPANDNFANAEPFTSVPFSATVDITDAGNEPAEPQFCNFMNRTVWYEFTPSETIAVRADTDGSSIGADLNVYEKAGTEIFEQNFRGCTGSTGSFSFLAEAGKTYYLQAGDRFNQEGTIQINLRQVFPPDNDQFAGAQEIDQLPFSASPDITDATTEPNEQQFCSFVQRTVWYSFSPTETVKVRANTDGGSVPGNVSIYRGGGSGISDLQFLNCSSAFGSVTFTAEAGEQYYVQVGAAFGDVGSVQINLSEVTTISGRVVDAVTGAPLPGNSSPFAFVSLYRICGDNCLEFVNSQQADGEGRFLFDGYYFGPPLSPGSYQINASATLYELREFGPFEFTGASLDVGDIGLTPPAVIRGRVVSEQTGNPLPGTSITLFRCNDGGGCFEFVNSGGADGDGRFLFDRFYFGSPLPSGTYELEFFANLHEITRVQVTIEGGEDRDLGDVVLRPLPLIGSISGTVRDNATGKSIPLVFTPFVNLYRCHGDACFEFVASQTADSAGRFRFETDHSGNPLPAGRYLILAFADQYQQGQIGPFDVGEDEHKNLGNMRLNSLPVRFSDVQPCAQIPTTGGDCVFSVRVWNGSSTALEGTTWSMVSGSLPGSFAGFTEFQALDRRQLNLGRGQSAVVQFRFAVPANNSGFGTFLCPRIFVTRGDSLFNTFGFRDLFCVLRNAGGLSIASPQEVMALDQQSPTATGTEIEPNNSCQAPQDVGTFSEAFVLDGNLDSSEAPDVDFFRFTGTPGLQATVDLEGASTGQGTLGDPFLGFFDSNCNLLALNDDSGGTLNSRLEITLPADGVFVLGVTRCCDSGFFGGGQGSYQLTITPVQFIGSITGRVTDAATGRAVRGDVAPFAFVRLLRCSDFNCFDVNNQMAGTDGRFSFTSDFNGMPLRVGSYIVVVSANQYQTRQTDVFEVGNGENLNIGDVPINSFPVRFSDIQTCQVPAAGGVCQFSVRVTNGLSTQLTGQAWSLVHAAGTGSFTNFTTFQTDSIQNVNLGRGKSAVLQFQFNVSGSVANGATICATVFVGQGQSPFFNTVGASTLFCIQKGSTGFTVLSDLEAQTFVRTMEVQELNDLIAPNTPSAKPQ